MADINEFYLADLSWRIASRELSSSEVVNAALARLERMQAKLNAFITVLAEPAIAEAKRADEEIARGRPRGPLHGVPVTIKDMFETAGVLTTGGSKILADWVPTTDSHLVERLRAAGAIIIGKTNLDEFGHGGTSTLSHFGPVHNPWNVDRIAGGSSGGAAARWLPASGRFPMAPRLAPRCAGRHRIVESPASKRRSASLTDTEPFAVAGVQVTWGCVRVP